MLRWASSRLKADKDVVMVAVQSSREKALHWHPLQLCDPSLRGNRDVALAALRCETQPSPALSLLERCLLFWPCCCRLPMKDYKEYVTSWTEKRLHM